MSLGRPLLHTHWIFKILFNTFPPSLAWPSTQGRYLCSAVSCLLKKTLKLQCRTQLSPDRHQQLHFELPWTWDGLCTELVRLNTAPNLQKHSCLPKSFLKAKPWAGAGLNPSGISLDLEESERVIPIGLQVKAGRFPSGFVRHIPQCSGFCTMFLKYQICFLTDMWKPIGAGQVDFCDMQKKTHFFQTWDAPVRARLHPDKTKPETKLILYCSPASPQSR